MELGKHIHYLILYVDNTYAVIKTTKILFNNFPDSLIGCGRDMSCFRQCSTSPECPPDESNYMVVINMSQNKKEVIISLGGIVNDEQVHQDQF